MQHGRGERSRPTGCGGPSPGAGPARRFTPPPGHGAADRMSGEDRPSSSRHDTAVGGQSALPPAHAAVAARTRGKWHAMTLVPPQALQYTCSAACPCQSMPMRAQRSTSKREQHVRHRCAGGGLGEVTCMLLPGRASCRAAFPIGSSADGGSHATPVARRV